MGIALLSLGAGLLMTFGRSASDVNNSLKETELETSVFMQISTTLLNSNTCNTALRGAGGGPLVLNLGGGGSTIVGQIVGPGGVIFTNNQVIQNMLRVLLTYTLTPVGQAPGRLVVGGVNYRTYFGTLNVTLKPLGNRLGGFGIMHSTPLVLGVRPGGRTVQVCYGKLSNDQFCSNLGGVMAGTVCSFPNFKQLCDTIVPAPACAAIACAPGLTPSHFFFLQGFDANSAPICRCDVQCN